ncbi:branched-chain amino acid ABC transporter permease [Muricoccus pecuniae]|uniref:Branched-chain amino acid transport system permease protein n=1 Tax=Muricoccus pecuniae TaxID=693023 RepID=A0A840Y5H3_9PROT|nr:branched-chain amino acid ABC transporter permease [Roseomonas pecuniae]MBB5696388.1 branched-chain amino acid transport system permease protein [Roseomonas pecuniae]
MFRRADLRLAAAGAVLLAATSLMPGWLLVLAATALAKGIVALGLLLLMRAGLVPFGQAMFYCLGGYAAGLGSLWLGIRDVLLLLLLAGLAAGAAGWVVGLLIRRYRGIFFAMLSMAFSMILYGVLLKSQDLGSSDGFSVPRPTLLGLTMTGTPALRILFAVTVLLTVLLAWGVSAYLRTAMGQIGPAIRQNEVRVSYLGYEPDRLIHREYAASGLLAGVAGALVAMLVGQVDPGMGFWMTSGEFVFIAILAGTGGIWGSLGAAFILEAVHAIAFDVAPTYWRLILGGTLLVMILRFPAGLSSLAPRRVRRA